MSAPRAWGCFHRRRHGNDRLRVFSTCVEVFLPERPYRGPRCSLLHVRGVLLALRDRF